MIRAYHERIGTEMAVARAYQAGLAPISAQVAHKSPLQVVATGFCGTIPATKSRLEPYWLKAAS